MTKQHARVFAQTLKDTGIRYIFGIPSGNWVDYMEAIRETEGIEFVLVSNEASGGFMADACWRLTGQMAACFGTFGPGACNLSTGVCCGLLDRSPMLVFTDEMSDQMLHRTTQMNIDHQALLPRSQSGPPALRATASRYPSKGIGHRPLRSARPGPHRSSCRGTAFQQEPGKTGGSSSNSRHA